MYEHYQVKRLQNQSLEHAEFVFDYFVVYQHMKKKNFPISLPDSITEDITVFIFPVTLVFNVSTNVQFVKLKVTTKKNFSPKGLPGFVLRINEPGFILPLNVTLKLFRKNVETYHNRTHNLEKYSTKF